MTAITKESNKTKYKSVSFEEVYNISRVPLLKLGILGREYFFMIDSGSTINLLGQELVESIPEFQEHIEEGEEVSILGTSTHRVYNEEEDSFSFDKASLTSKRIITSISQDDQIFTGTRFLVKSLPVLKEIKTGSKIPVAGVIGTKFLEYYGWTVDFENMVIWMRNE